MRLPFPSGATRDFGPVADHHLGAAYLGERLAPHCAWIDAWEDVSRGAYSTVIGGGDGEHIVFSCVVATPAAFAEVVAEFGDAYPGGTHGDDGDVGGDAEFDGDPDADPDDEDDPEEEDEAAFARMELLDEAADALHGLVDARAATGGPRPRFPFLVNWYFYYLRHSDLDAKTLANWDALARVRGRRLRPVPYRPPEGAAAAPPARQPRSDAGP